MVARFGFIIFGTLVVIIPIRSFLKGTPSSFYGQPGSVLGDIALFLFGIAIISLTIFNPRSLIKQKYICPKCEEMVETVESKLTKCKTCEIEMEKLNGYYERKK